jgi:hypothetical protein
LLHWEGTALEDDARSTTSGGEDEKELEAAFRLGAPSLSQSKLDEHDAMNKDLRADIEDVEALRAALRKLDESMTIAEERAELAESKLECRYAELAYLTKALLDAEARLERSGTALNWLLDVSRSLMSGRPWWWHIMPNAWQRKRDLRRLAEEGLFDAQAYSVRYPDVKEAGLDPLHHYMFHGMHEVIAGTR